VPKITWLFSVVITSLIIGIIPTFAEDYDVTFYLPVREDIGTEWKFPTVNSVYDEMEQANHKNTGLEQYIRQGHMKGNGFETNFLDLYIYGYDSSKNAIGLYNEHIEYWKNRGGYQEWSPNSISNADECYGRITTGSITDKVSLYCVNDSIVIFVLSAGFEFEMKDEVTKFANAVINKIDDDKVFKVNDELNVDTTQQEKTIEQSSIEKSKSANEDVRCDIGQYAMNGKCYEMPDLVPDLPDNLGFYEPWYSDSFGNEKKSFTLDETVFITSVLDNQGDKTFDYTVSLRYLKAEIGEWSQWNFAKSQINAGDIATVTLPFLKASEIKDTQIQIQLSDDWGIVYTYDYTPQVSIESEEIQEQKILFPFVDPKKDPQHYIDRYNNEPIYKKWFDTNYFGHTIEEAVGINSESEIISLPQNNTIPQWVKGIFAFYVNGGIGDEELIEALQFLIKEGIIQV
jgi:hypothetical protein